MNSIKMNKDNHYLSIYMCVCVYVCVRVCVCVCVFMHTLTCMLLKH